MTETLFETLKKEETTRHVMKHMFALWAKSGTDKQPIAINDAELTQRADTTLHNICANRIIFKCCGDIIYHNRTVDDPGRRYALAFYVMLDQMTQADLVFTFKDSVYLVWEESLYARWPPDRLLRANRVTLTLNILKPDYQRIGAMITMLDRDYFVPCPSAIEMQRKLRRHLSITLPLNVVQNELDDDYYRMVAKHTHTTVAEASDRIWNLVHVCSICGRYGFGLNKCGRCLSVYYCSVECQRRDWKARHRERCASPTRTIK